MQIRTLDLHHQGVPKTIASFLVIGAEGPILVETGPASALDTLHAQLAAHGYTAADIKHILVTHIHFDHAGAAGWLARHGAQVYVHPLGAPHLIDPSKLVSSASRIYGDKMHTLWGDIVPIPEAQITPVYDGDTISVAGLRLKAIETPGHARHHHVFRLGEVAFVGDAAGVQLHDMPLLNLPAPPPEFDLESWRHTLDRLQAEDFEAIYLTHFGRQDKVRQHLEALKELLGKSATFIYEHMRAGRDRDEIVSAYESWNRQRARDAGATPQMIHQYETANPLYMSVDGIMRYWRKKDGRLLPQSTTGKRNETRVN